MGNWLKSMVQETGHAGYTNLEIINGQMVFKVMGLYKII